MEFREIIRALRLEKKENQGQVAQAIGLTVRQYQRYEAGGHRPWPGGPFWRHSGLSGRPHGPALNVKR